MFFFVTWIHIRNRIHIRTSLLHHNVTSVTWIHIRNQIHIRTSLLHHNIPSVPWVRFRVVAGVDAAAAGVRGVGQLAAAQAARREAGDGPPNGPPERRGSRPAH